MTDTLPWSGKLALVTGASGNIGAAIARTLAAGGATVVAHFGENEARATAVVRDIVAAGGEAVAVGADLGQPDGPATIMRALDAAFGGRFAGRLDVLVNNAGIFEYGALADTTDDDFDRAYNVNVRAVFALSREAARRMTTAGWGRIITIGSVFGASSPMPGFGLYSGTKFAVAGMARAWSRDLGGYGVTVNVVQPALIQPEPWPSSGPAFDAMRRFASVERFGRPDEIARAVAFLAADASGFINGATLDVDGGWSA